MTGAQLEAVLDGYPTLRGARGMKHGEVEAAPGETVPFTSERFGHPRITVFKDAAEGISNVEDWDLRAAMFSVVEINRARPLWPHAEYVGYALPTLAGGPSPKPLMLWWALLLALSSLARYHPAKWSAAIDPKFVAAGGPARAGAEHRRGAGAGAHPRSPAGVIELSPCCWVRCY